MGQQTIFRGHIMDQEFHRAMAAHVALIRREHAREMRRILAAIAHAPMQPDLLEPEEPYDLIASLPEQVTCEGKLTKPALRLVWSR